GAYPLSPYDPFVPGEELAPPPSTGDEPIASDVVSRTRGDDLARVASRSGLDRPATGALWPRWLFLRALGVIYLSAFYSFLRQMRGLVGAHGILPATEFLADVLHYFTGGVVERLWQVPT